LVSFPVHGQESFRGAGRFPQFRNLSGLAGGGFGVNSSGDRSLEGATAFSSPIAYVLGHRQLHITYASLSFDSLPNFDRPRSNGTAALMYGHTLGRFNVAGTFLIKSLDGDQVYNVQVQYQPHERSRWSFSLGAQDIEGRGGAAGEGAEGDGGMSRSIFGVVTYRFYALNRPIYVSLGSGRRRFGRIFGSVSMPIARSTRFWLEQDGFGINYGLLFASRPFGSRSRFEWNTTIGLVQGRYFVLAGGIGF
jgi:hypothetical protein